ncbi:MAG: DinB family protein [Planctomycetota bacterium]
MDSTVLVETLLVGWNRNADYAQRLVADLDANQMVMQPAAGTNHPAWTFSHLCAYHPVLTGLLRGEPCEDPKDHRFGMKSKPEADRSVYPAKDELMACFAEGHELVTAALQAADEQLLTTPMSIERWATVFPQVSSCLGYLMLAHESTHLGQVSAWRRVQGLPSV